MAMVLALLAPTPAVLAAAERATWRWPVSGPPRILRRFTPPPAPWLAGHRGIDLAAPAATPVLAAGQGTVGYAGSVAGRGVVTVNHPGGLRTTYLPVAAAVRSGDPVAPGDRLGTVQPGSAHCLESCLHWGLRRATVYLDPLLLLGQTRIRLLPYWHANAPETVSPSPPSTPPRPDHHTADEHPSPQTLADRRHPSAPIAATDHFVLRSTATPMVQALGGAALLAVPTLLALRRHRKRPPRSRDSPAGGKHSQRRGATATTGQHRKPRRQWRP